MMSRTTIRSFLFYLPFSSIAAIGQTDVTFPNVSADFEEVWICMTPNDGPYNMYVNYQYSSEPSIDSLGFPWGHLNWMGMDQYITVDGSTIRIINQMVSDSVRTLYDFSLQVGDTAYFDTYIMDDHVVVSSIDTIDIEGRARKRFFLSNEDIWLEGIGSMQGVLRPQWVPALGCAATEYSFCANYLDSNSIEYTWCSDLVMNKEEISSGDPRVYPIPCNDHLTIRSHRSGELFQIVDMKGRILRSGILISDHHTLDVSALAPGMYLLVLANGITKVLVE